MSALSARLFVVSFIAATRASLKSSALNSPAVYQNPFITSGTALSAFSSCSLTLMASRPDLSRATWCTRNAIHN